MPTFLAIAGEPDIIGKLKKGGYKANGRTYKNHIDGFDLTDYITGKVKESPRNVFFYFSDDGDVLALRYDNWKMTFMEQRCRGTMQVWAEPFNKLRMPTLFNLRTVPYEYALITSNTYYDWYLNKAYRLFAAQAVVGMFMETFKTFPPRQKAASFTVEQAHDKMAEAATGSR